jgi:transposase
MTERISRKPRGRPAKPISDPDSIVKAVILFLQLFMAEALAKRIVSIVLIAAGIANERIIAMTGLSKGSICALKNEMHNGNTDALFIRRHGGGRTGKAKGFEGAIAEELEKNNYHTRQQVADMILEKFDIRMSVSAVGKLLKKTASGA